MTHDAHATPLDDALPTTGSFNPDLQSFDDAMTAFMQKRNVPGGSLAVVKEGRLVYARGYGVADKATEQRVQPGSLFRIASISKPFTAVAMLTLIQNPRYKLSLDTRAFPLLGVAPHLELGAKLDPRLEFITIRQLLQHTGGWDRDKSGDPMFKPLEIAHTLGTPAPADARAIIRWMLGKPLDTDPGTHYAYSNFGYCVLGRVIEKVTGMPYGTYVQQAVLTPLHIQRMALGRSLRKNRRENEVRYYQPGEQTASIFPESNGEQVSWCYGGFNIEAMDAHGGWLASAVDLARFAGGLDFPQGRPLLTPESVRAMYARPGSLQEAAATANPVYYGCGWQVRDVGGGAQEKRNIWHTGSLPGTSAWLIRRWDGLTWAALFNQRSEGNMPSDGEIDGALHVAADKVKTWPEGDLFASYR